MSQKGFLVALESPRLGEKLVARFKDNVPEEFLKLDYADEIGIKDLHVLVGSLGQLDLHQGLIVELPEPYKPS